MPEISRSTPQPQNNPYGTAYSDQEWSVIAVIAFIAAFLFAPLGLILGIVALSQLKKKPQRGRGLAIAAIVISIVLMLLVALLIALGVFLVTSVLQLVRELPTQCTFDDTLSCAVVDADPTAGVITLAVWNDFGADLTVTDVSSVWCEDAVPRMFSVGSNDNVTVKLSGCSLTVGKHFTDFMMVNYTAGMTGIPKDTSAIVVVAP